MSVRATFDEPYDDDLGCDDGLDRECSWCGGEGMQESDDPLWDLADWVKCSACGGSGLAKDQTIW